MTNSLNYLRTVLLITIFGFILMNFSCKRVEYDSELLEIEKKIYGDPKEAVDLLKQVDISKFDKTNRNLYNLLTIKAKDKAYITHENDSLIKELIDFFESSGDQGRYAEALYYGGRIYDDLGDKPGALNYYHNTLENLPVDSIDSDFEANVNYQVANILSNSRMYEESLPYMNRAIEIDKILGDTMGLFYDLRLLGQIFIHARNFYDAEKYFNQAKSLGKKIPDEHQALNNLFLAQIYNNRGEKDSAIQIVRRNLPFVHPISRNTALTIASEIYKKAGIYDSAYIFADELIHNSNPVQKSIGYYHIISPGVRDFIPKDSLIEYVENYRIIVEKKFNENEADLLVLNQAAYNYSLQEKETLKILNEKKKFQVWFYIILGFGIISLTIAIIFFIRYKKVKKQKDDYLNEQIETQTSHDVISENKRNDSIRINQERKKLFEEINRLNTEHPNYKVPLQIIESNTYKKISDILKKSMSLSEQDPVWNEIEDLVFQYSPDFKKKLIILTQNEMTEVEYQTALLIHLGFSSTNIGKAIGRTTSTIGSRRDSLLNKIYEEKIQTAVFHNILRLL